MTPAEANTLTPFERELLEELRKLRRTIDEGCDKVAEALKAV